MSLETAVGQIILKPGRDKPVRQKHPWIFSGSIDLVTGDPPAGSLVTIANAKRELLATAYYNPQSQITGRIVAWHSDGQTQPIDSVHWRALLERAYRGRFQLANQNNTTAYRLVHGESDQLPGMVVDLYNDILVIQFLTLGMDVRREMWTEILATTALPNGQLPAGIIERSDAKVRRKEGLRPVSGVLWGVVPDTEITIQENGIEFLVNMHDGHKTGFYLDQRDNRALIGRPEWVEGKELLNVFSYTGGFAAYAGRAGAGKITNIDSSFSALELAERNVLLNSQNRESDEYISGDAFQILRDYRDQERHFDAVILDPPKFVHSQRDMRRATRGYKDINWLGFRLTRPGGILATFSCSGLISADLFQKIIFGAALDAGRDVQIIRPMAQGIDHPISLSFPESAYLKGFLCRVW